MLNTIVVWACIYLLFDSFVKISVVNARFSDDFDSFLIPIDYMVDGYALFLFWLF